MTSRTRFAVLLLAAVSAASSGCITQGKRSLSVGQLQPCWLDAKRSCKRPIDFTLLQRAPADEHVVLGRDVLGIYVEGILSGAEISSAGSELPGVNYEGAEGRQSPALGHPFVVQADGTLRLPLIEPMNVAGLSLQQVADEVRRAYEQSGALQSDPKTAYVQVALIRRRTNRVLVLREDAPVQSPSLTRRDTYTLANRGSGTVIELAEANSDLLNALIQTGGLPGEDASSDVWVLRGGSNWDQAAAGFDAGMEASQIAGDAGPSRRHTIIPLRHACGTPLPFSRQDVVLRDGDVVFVEKRQEDYFYTGGLLPGGKIPLPRDEDVDILEAIALSNTGVGGPAGINASASQFRSGPGNVIPPTRALVVRKLASGQQVKIDVDLRKAVDDPEERIRIQPEDFVMLQYRRHELIGNIMLNFVNVNYSWVDPVD